MKQKLGLLMATICLASFALAQIIKAVGTLTNDATMARLRVGTSSSVAKTLTCQ